MGKRDSKRREMAKLVARWRASGKSAASFAREAGIPESRLWYWVRLSALDLFRDRRGHGLIADPGVRDGSSSAVGAVGIALKVAVHVTLPCDSHGFHSGDVGTSGHPPAFHRRRNSPGPVTE